ncbi:hypothetical protein COO60DRAFT_1479725, partial [Scenedesmus sp. NREL 46B-D3]
MHQTFWEGWGWLISGAFTLWHIRCCESPDGFVVLVDLLSAWLCINLCPPAVAFPGHCQLCSLQVAAAASILVDCKRMTT